MNREQILYNSCDHIIRSYITGLGPWAITKYVKYQKWLLPIDVSAQFYNEINFRDLILDADTLHGPDVSHKVLALLSAELWIGLLSITP